MSPSDFPVRSVEVIVTYDTPSGLVPVTQKVEATNTLKLSKVRHETHKQFKPQKDEEGHLIGHEPTGVETMTVVVRYIREP